MRKALFILGILNDADIDWLAAVGRRQAVPKGSVLLQEGQPTAMFYILLEGRLSVFSEAHPEHEINFLLPGEVIGELSFLDSRPPSATVAAEADCFALAVPRDQLNTKLTRDAGFAARFYRALGIFLAHRLRRCTCLFARAGVTAVLEAEEEIAGELDPLILDSVALGGHRFQYLLERVGTA
jgi:CRP-like cAMP-binding protein